MSDHLDEFDQWLREEYASTWPDFGLGQPKSMRTAYDGGDQAERLGDAHMAVVKSRNEGSSHGE